MSEVQNFFYRGPRLAVQLPVSLKTENFTFSGYTKNMSEHGVLVRLNGFVPPQTTGQLVLDIGAASFSLDVVALYTEVLDVGLSIRFTSDAERAFFEKFVKSIFRNSQGKTARSALE